MHIMLLFPCFNMCYLFLCMVIMLCNYSGFLRYAGIFWKKQRATARRFLGVQCGSRAAGTE